MSKLIKDFVYSYKTKHKQGFTKTEIESLLEEMNINEKRFYKALGINTCMVIEGEIITYHTDVLKSVICAVENRQQNIMEWD